MKKISLFLLTAFAAVTVTSCNDSKSDYPDYAQFVSVYPLTGNNFYLKTNSGKTLYPSDKTRISGYTAKETTPAQRAVIYYKMLDQKAEGYDYNIQPYAIYDIYTAAAKIVTTTEDLEKLADDKIHYGSAELTSNFLTLEIAYPVVDNSMHTFNLIFDGTDPVKAPTNEGYLDVQLRHNAGDDSDGRDSKFYVSFELSALKERLKDAKGITLRVNTPQDGVQYVKVKFPAEK